MSIVSKPNIAIIPARGGSKGIKRKNLAQVKGLPLLAWSIEAAKEAKLVDRVFVTTDDPEIRDAALEYGAEAPFLRPTPLAGDSADLRYVFEHTHRELANRNIDFAAQVVLYPTSPFRTPSLIDRSIELALKYRSTVSSLAVVPLSTHQLFAKTESRCRAIDFRQLAPIVKRMGIVIASVNNQAHQNFPFASSFVSTIERLIESDVMNCEEAFSFLTDGYSPLLPGVPTPPISELVPYSSIIIHDVNTLLDIDTPADLEHANGKSFSELPWTPSLLRMEESEELKIKRNSPRKHVKGSELFYLYGQDSAGGISTLGTIDMEVLSSPSDVQKSVREAVSLEDAPFWISRFSEPPNQTLTVHSEPVLLLDERSPIAANCFFAFSEIAQARFLFAEGSEPTQWLSEPLSFSTEQGKLSVDLSQSFAVGDSLLLIVHTFSPLQVMEVSRFQQIRKEGWQQVTFTSFGFQDESLFSIDGDDLVLEYSELPFPFQVFVSRQRAANLQQDERFVCSPLELPEFTNYDFSKCRWVNAATDVIISGRQQEPDIHPWGGWAFIPSGEINSPEWRVVTEQEFFHEQGE